MNFARALYPLARPLLHSIDPEKAHKLTLTVLKAMPSGAARRFDPALHVECWGLSFPNPLGLAAGFDKNAEVPDAMLGLGFGFVEVGSVTPRPQAGNPHPRLFRLTEDDGVINRLGFNNEGHEAVLRRLIQRSARGGIIGVNLGANKDAPDRIADYVDGLRSFADVASYVTVNISSPNTPGLRGLQSRNELARLLSRLLDARKGLPRPVPLVIKIAPDLDGDDLVSIASVCMEMNVDGIAVSNTTISRPPLKSPHRGETGGLSGKPLFALSTQQLAKMYVLTKGAIPLIGIGGIFDAETAWIKLRAGATLIQLYSALVYRGPQCVEDILTGLSQKCAVAGLKNISEATGVDAERLAHHGLSGT
jgi:dihydroorotate dehydrogenase